MPLVNFTVLFGWHFEKSGRFVKNICRWIVLVVRRAVRGSRDSQSPLAGKAMLPIRTQQGRRGKHPHGADRRSGSEHTRTVINVRLAAPTDRKRNGRRGSELVEFTLVLLPLLAILFVLVDVSWAIFAKATLLYAVRTGVRTGITITSAQASAANETLTQMVKDTVQSSALGFLRGDTGRSYIQVHYFAQDATSPTGLSDVSAQPNGNYPGNLMQVSVNNYPLPGLAPRIFGWFTPADKSPTVLNVVSADRVEPSGDVPPIGAAP